MADNVAITAGTGTTVAADDVGGVLHQRVKTTWGPDGTANDADVATGKPLPVQVRSATGLIPIGEPTDAKSTATDATSTTGISIWKQISASIQALAAGAATTLGQAVMAASVPVVLSSDQTAIPVTGASSVTISTDVVLPTSSVYAINDAISDSTSAPTSGGFTFTGAGRISGGSGMIVDAVITSSGDLATPLQGEIWIFDTAVTNINDNAAFVVSDAEIKTYVGKIPFAMEDAGNNQAAHVLGLNIGFTCVGSANLRFLIKAKNAYTPATDTLTFRLKIMHTS